MERTVTSTNLATDNNEINNREKRPHSPFRKAFQKLDHLSKREQLSLRIPEKTGVRLKEIQKFTGAKSINDVVNNALEFYDQIFQEIEQGNSVSLAIETKDGDCYDYEVFEQ